MRKAIVIGATSGIGRSLASRLVAEGYRVGVTGRRKRELELRPGFIDTAMAKGDGQFWVASPEKAARQIVSLLKRRRDVGYVTKRWQLIATLLKIVPHQIYKNL